MRRRRHQQRQDHNGIESAKGHRTNLHASDRYKIMVAG
jgi:hypothetical protein